MNNFQSGITPVSDAASNAQDQIAYAAKTLGRSSNRLKVFEEIYHGKKRIKTVDHIARLKHLNRKQVLNEGRKLVRARLVEPAKFKGDTAYEKIDFFHQHKRQILNLAKNKEKLNRFPTKWNPRANANEIRIRLNVSRARANSITIDEIESFKKVKKVKESGLLKKELSESKFKKGIQKIIGESGIFKDWGGEKNDLFTTRIKIGTKRYSTAFAFKGPGTKGKLVPGKMGKNGDQIQRLFEADADIFLIQYWREIDHSVLDLMSQLARNKSLMTGKTILYGIIDGQDSKRIYSAYKAKFG